VTSAIEAIASLLAAVALAGVHLAVARIPQVAGAPRSRWLSAAGGATVAFVFLILLPELVRAHRALIEAGALSFLRHHVYFFALVSLLAFYGLERAARASRPPREGRVGTAVFWMHVVVFCVYNGFIGYLLVSRVAANLRDLLFFAGAMGLHLAVNDYGLREHHGEAYIRRGRWLLATAVLVGWALGMVLHVSPVALGILIAVVSGGLVLNVLKEELPREPEMRFWPFVLGALGCSLLLLVSA
jgi:hypothetical protein